MGHYKTPIRFPGRNMRPKPVYEKWTRPLHRERTTGVGLEPVPDPVPEGFTISTQGNRALVRSGVRRNLAQWQELFPGCKIFFIGKLQPAQGFDEIKFQKQCKAAFKAKASKAPQ